MIIASRQNPTYKRLQRIVEGKRPIEGDQPALWLEGPNLCQSWLQHYGAPELVVVDADREPLPEVVQQLLDTVSARQQVMLGGNLMKALSSVEQGQGVAFVVQRPVVPAQPILKKAALLLDRVQDPGNLGTLLRTAAAAGITEVFLSVGCADAWSQKSLRSGQGAHFALAIHENQDLQALLQQAEVPVYTTTLSDRAQSLFALEIAKDGAWLFGNEGRGVHPDLLEQSRHQVFIPQEAAVESLNVAVAAAICLFEQRRQHLAG